MNITDGNEMHITDGNLYITDDNMNITDGNLILEYNWWKHILNITVGTIEI